MSEIELCSSLDEVQRVAPNQMRKADAQIIVDAAHKQIDILAMDTCNVELGHTAQEVDVWVFYKGRVDDQRQEDDACIRCFFQLSGLPVAAKDPRTD